MTARQFEAGKLVVASHNQGKVREMTALLAPFGIVTISSAELNLPEPEETGTTFIANAELKALAAARASGLAALADDSGLCVDVLDGAPGIYSARWASGGADGDTDVSGEKDFSLAMERVMKRVMEEVKAATANNSGDSLCKAHFICALTLAWADGHTESFEGKVEGSLVFPPRGEKGFGYDPIFLPDGENQTFAEIDPEIKHAMSHRADAFGQLVKACFKNAKKNS